MDDTTHLVLCCHCLQMQTAEGMVDRPEGWTCTPCSTALDRTEQARRHQLTTMGYDSLDAWAWDYGCFLIEAPSGTTWWETPDGEEPIEDLGAYFDNEMQSQAELDYERRYNQNI